jgi:hypothetical protein
LQWLAFEAVEGIIEPIGAATIVAEPGSTWPLRPVPDGATPAFRFDETGEVEYTFTDPTGERKKDMLRSYDDVLRSARERVKRLQQ